MNEVNAVRAPQGAGVPEWNVGVPAGVFNLVLGRGRVLGEAMAAHPGIDMISFTGSTGSTGAGARVGEVAARTVKRTCLELGGKSANVVLRDADLGAAARWNVQGCFFNTGQSCHAPSRMIVHESQVETVLRYLADEAARFVIGDPRDPATTMGSAARGRQFDRVQRHIQAGLEAGARLVCGGPGRPEGLGRGHFLQPTVLAGGRPDMVVATEEIFGPGLAVVPDATEEEAIALANDSICGLGGYVLAGDRARGHEVARRLRAGRVCLSGAPTDSLTPMGATSGPGSAAPRASSVWRNIWNRSRSVVSVRRPPICRNSDTWPLPSRPEPDTVPVRGRRGGRATIRGRTSG